MVRKRVWPWTVFVSRCVSLWVQVSGMLGVLGGTNAMGEVVACCAEAGGGGRSLAAHLPLRVTFCPCP